MTDSNHKRAMASVVRARIELALRCGKCGATNGPGRRYVELDERGISYYCTVCGHDDAVPDQSTS